MFEKNLYLSNTLDKVDTLDTTRGIKNLCPGASIIETRGLHGDVQGVQDVQGYSQINIFLLEDEH